ncbi:hypothetical protein DIPPA_10903 [Diplonema papillatum]|nr:hypothetical protein DIPPA_10903 [Diplonema papillatum]
MPSHKVRRQLIFVNACRRRLKKMSIENGDQVAEGSSKSASFAQMVEELRMVMDAMNKLKKECDAVKNKKDGDAVRKRHEFNTEIKRAKDLLAEMRMSLRSLQKKIEKADKKGKTDNEKHQARVAELRTKEDTITALFSEIEKLSVQREHEVPALSIVTKA